MREILFLGASKLAAAIRARELSAVEVFEAHLDQLERHNGKLNAIVTHDDVMGRKRAQEADEALARGELWGPLHGVPITVKDSLETQGLRTTASFKPLVGHIPTRDATAISRMRRAGAIIWAKTNMPALAMDYQSYSPIFGCARNPFDLNRTPGGSTGGGAAAVAAGMSPLEMGSDIAGSLRVAAHFCGVLSFKPTEHIVSQAGHIPELPHQPRGVRHMACIGPVARTVEDLRMSFRLIAGPDDRDWEVPPLPIPEPRPKPLSDLRIAWADDLGGLAVSADTRRAITDVAEKLAARGCRIERAAPSGFDFEEARVAWGEMLGAEIGGALPIHQRLLLQLQFRSYAGDDPMAAALARGPSFSLKEYLALLWRRDLLIAALERFLDDYDALLCPVAMVPAIPHCKSGALIDVDGVKRTYLSSLGGYACVFNVTGHPVVVLPVGRSAGGLPIGVQLVGPRWSDAKLLDMAETLSEVTGPVIPPPGY